MKHPFLSRAYSWNSKYSKNGCVLYTWRQTLCFTGGQTRNTEKSKNSCVLHPWTGHYGYAMKVLSSYSKVGGRYQLQTQRKGEGVLITNVRDGEGEGNSYYRC